MQIHLRNILDEPIGYGHVCGQRVGQHLRLLIDARPAETTIGLSLAGIEHIDVTFAAESIVALARHYRKLRGFCLVDTVDQDLLDNVDGAAWKLEQPIIAWSGRDTYQLLGPSPAEGLYQVLQYVYTVPVAYTRAAAQDLALGVPNASNKLKELWRDGYILRDACSASSGGVEFAYKQIAAPIP